MYGLILIDEYDAPYSTTHVITDEVLWEWLQTPVEFADGETTTSVPLPAGYTTDEGSTIAEDITIGSSQNDMAQVLVGITENHPDAVQVVDFETDAEDNDQYLADAKKTLTALGVKDIYEGLWY